MSEQPLPRRGKRLVLPHAIWLLTYERARQLSQWQRAKSDQEVTR
jgi:hypothetical protein